MKPDKKEQLISWLKAIIGWLGSEFYTNFYMNSWSTEIQQILMDGLIKENQEGYLDGQMSSKWALW